MLQVAKERIDWEDWKKKQAMARAEGRWLGIGIGTTLDSGTNNFGESQIVNPHAPFSGNSQGANCKLDIYGEVVVAVGSCPQGQGHETTAAQVVADVLNISPDLIAVRTGFDTERNVHTGFSGTYASQFAVSGLSAVHGAAQKLKAEMKRLGAFALQAKEDDIEFGIGAQGPELRAKSNGKCINYWGLANLVNANSAALPPELYEVTLNCRLIWRAPFKVPDKQKKYGHIETPSPHSYSGAKGMGEGGAAPIHTISAALQDAVFDKGIVIEDSFNNADSLFRALVGKETSQAEKLVKEERRA